MLECSWHCEISSAPHALAPPIVIVLSFWWHAGKGLCSMGMPLRSFHPSQTMPEDLGYQPWCSSNSPNLQMFLPALQGFNYKGEDKALTFASLLLTSSSLFWLYTTHLQFQEANFPLLGGRNLLYITSSSQFFFDFLYSQPYRHWFFIYKILSELKV